MLSWRRATAAAARRLLSTELRSPSAPALEFLLGKGYDAQVSASILKAITPSSSPSVRELQAFGDGGLEAIAQAVRRELDAAKQSAGKPLVNLILSAPHAGIIDVTVQARSGSTLLDVAKESTLVGEQLECACNGIAACSTCHVILSPDQMHHFPPPTEAEQDMLDLAAELTPTSRLGCQLVLLADKHDNLKITLPKTFNNLW